MTLMLFKESALIKGVMETEGWIFALLFMIQIHMGSNENMSGSYWMRPNWSL